MDNEIEDKKFRIYWLDGTTNVVTGPAINIAFTRAGYGHGAVKAIDFYNEVEDITHEWDVATKDWKPIKPVFQP